MKTFLRPSLDQDKIISQFPITFNNYYEPFLSSGEVFFNLYKNARVFQKAFLSSSNTDLIRTYIAVRDEPERLQKLISNYCENNSKAFFDAMQRATATPSAYIYVNRAANHRGQWRESQFIDQNKEISKDTDTIDRCSRYMNRWCQSIRNIDWEMALTNASEGDLVWLTPPRIPATLDGRIDYVTNGFNESNHVYLNNFCKQLFKKGVKVFLIQSNTTGTHRIYGEKYNLNLIEGTCLYVY